MDSKLLQSVSEYIVDERELPELVFLVFLSLVAIVFILDASQLSSGASILPVFAGYSIVLVTGILLLKGIIPTQVVDLLGLSEAETRNPSEIVDADEASTAKLGSSNDRPPIGALLFMSGYFVLILLLGLYIATPIFVIAWGRWNGQRLRVTSLLTLVSVGVITVFATFVNPPRAGIFTDMIYRTLEGLLFGS